MKKFLVMGALAIALAITSQQNASAWVNFKTGIGANIALQSGGNCLLWGAFRNGQPPGPGGIDTGCGNPFGGGCNGPVGAPGHGPVGHGPAQGYFQPPVMDHGAGGYNALPPGAIPGRVQSYQNVYSLPRR